jgi:hypothetical protein
MKQQQSLEYKEELEWLIDFANMDLSTIKPGDKAKILIESEILFPIKEISMIEELPQPKNFLLPLAIDIDVTKVSTHNPWLLTEKEKRKMAWAFHIPDKKSEEYWNKILHLQEGIKEIFFGFCIASYESAFRCSLRIILRGDRGPNQPYSISYLPLTDSQDEYLSFKILRLLEGLPGNAVRQCPECKRYFLHTSLREKIFCSPRCLWKSNATKRRRQDPEGYKKYQRELMQDRYREKNGHKRLKTISRKAKKEG